MNRRAVPLATPSLQGNEWLYIKECLDTNWVSYVGPFVDRFQMDLATQCGSAYANATTSGTAALHLALLLAGVEPETEVIMPALTFVAPANAVRYCSAWPVLMDVNPSDWQLDVDKLSSFLKAGCQRKQGKLINRVTGRKVSAILPVHLLGDMCDVDSVAMLAAQFELPVVEDAAECIGATYKGRPIGAPTEAIGAAYRQVATSFNGNKIITTGGGGALFTNDARLAERARHLATTAKTDPVAFVHDEIGYNYRMSNVQAALGVAQLERLTSHVQRKREIATQYAEALSGIEGIAMLHPRAPNTEPIYWLYTIMLSQPSVDVIARLNEAGVQARPIWTPLAELPMFQSCYSFECEFAAKLQRQAISLPSSVDLSAQDHAYVTQVLTSSIHQPYICPENMVR